MKRNNVDDHFFSMQTYHILLVFTSANIYNLITNIKKNEKKLAD